jgi:hypothetical protein
VSGQAGTIATDATGRVYLAWHDGRNAWLQESGDGGDTWTPAHQLNAGLGAAVYPTVTASGAGVVDVAWYGTDRAGDANDPTATWSLWVARRARTGRFDRFVADPSVHSGPLCTRGDACTVPNSRDLFDDFGAATDPTRSLVTVLYTSDQPGGALANDSVRWVTFSR